MSYYTPAQPLTSPPYQAQSWEYLPAYGTLGVTPEQSTYGDLVKQAEAERRCGTSHGCYAFPGAAFFGTVLTGIAMLSDLSVNDGPNFLVGKYAAVGTASVVGLSVIATLSASLAEACKRGCGEAGAVWKRSVCSFRESEGMIVNSLSAVFPPTWFCWCRRNPED